MTRSDLALLTEAGRVAAAHRTVIFGEEWPLASATRYRIVHGYAFVDRRIIENTVRSDLPAIRASIEVLVGQLEETDRSEPEHGD